MQNLSVFYLSGLLETFHVILHRRPILIMTATQSFIHKAPPRPRAGCYKAIRAASDLVSSLMRAKGVWLELLHRSIDRVD